MVKSQYVSLQDAALLADKSPQTIRRLIKSNKIRYRKYKTPQGFTYLVERTSLLDHFDVAPVGSSDASTEKDMEPEMDEDGLDRLPDESPEDHGGVYNLNISATNHSPTQSPNQQPVEATHHPPQTPQASVQQSAQFQSIISQLVQQHRDDKKRLFELVEMFQKRILVLEDQLKQLKAPAEPIKKKRRFFFF